MDIERKLKCREVLISRLKEELSDVEKYSDIYNSLKEQGHYEDAYDIEEIARDEFNHATILCDILEDWGYDPLQNQDIAIMWHKAKDVFHMR